MNKYIAIVMKELRVIIPLTAVAVVVLLFFATNARLVFDHKSYLNSTFVTLTGESAGNHYESSIGGIISGRLSNWGYYNFLLTLSILSIVIGLIQFWLPKISGNWKFTLHRPVSRIALVVCMLLPAMVVVYFAGCISWYVTCNWFDQKTLIPVPAEYFRLGWQISIIPLTYYLVTVLTALNTTKFLLSLLPILLVLLLNIVLAQANCSSFTFYLTLTLFLAMTLPLIVSNFKNREY